MAKSTVLLIITIVILLSCSDDKTTNQPTDIDYRQEMRDFVIGISDYSKSIKPGFLIIPQNGIEILSEKGTTPGRVYYTNYLNAIDGHGQEDLFYGYSNDDVATPDAVNSQIRYFLDISRDSGNTILVTDYCSTQSKMDDSYSKNNSNGYISFAADHRELDNIPSYPSPIHSENSSQITSLSQVKNFLYLINPEKFSSKSDFIQSINSTNYDLLIMDIFFTDGTEFTKEEVEQLRNKANGGKRLVISYMSIGEAEDYRFYWKNEWAGNKPAWMDAENPNWAGNFKVKYWMKDWQDIIYGNNSSYVRKIIDANFDGVYLDIIDAFNFFETNE